MAVSKSNIPAKTSGTVVAPVPEQQLDKAVDKIKEKTGGGIVDQALKLLSSVRFGLIMLGTLLACCMTGMLIMQVSVEGFQKYYASLSPAKKAVFGGLGLFDIYHSWYFSLLLAITGLNIILASIDRFPAAWQYISKPKLIASPKFIQAQSFSTSTTEEGSTLQVIDRIKENWRRSRFRIRVSESGGRTTIFAQRNAWNRLGAYAVHVALLTIFTGGFLTNRYGYGGSMEIEPGKTSDQFAVLKSTLSGPQVSMMRLPFRIECLDLQQQLVKDDGGLDATNTIDWRSSIRIKDNGKDEDMVVHLNHVGSYQGYRFFQSQFSPVGNARQIVVSFQPVGGGPATTVTIPRNGSVDVNSIGKVRYTGFFPDFEITPSGFNPIATGDYNKPFAELEVTAPDGKRQMVVALGAQASSFFSSAGKGNDDLEKELQVNGQKVLLKDFEKVSQFHSLTIQYDPGRTPVYIGFVLLLLSLCSVFFFSHQRLWVVIEEENADASARKVWFGGNVNRNRQGFEETFNQMVIRATSQQDSNSDQEHNHE